MTDQTSDEAADVECWAAFELAMPNTATRTDEAWRGFQVGWQARAQHAQQAVERGPERCPTCGVRHRTVAPDSPLAKAHQEAVESEQSEVNNVTARGLYFDSDQQHELERDGPTEEEMLTLLADDDQRRRDEIRDKVLKEVAQELLDAGYGEAYEVVYKLQSQQPMAVESEREKVLQSIREAVEQYNQDLHDRKHGGVAMDKAWWKIIAALGTIKSQQPAQAVESDKKISEQNARFAIDGAITFGYQGANKPPTEDHWLMPFWLIGRQIRELELLEEVCAFYANDEDRCIKDEGEPYGSIPTEVGLKARSARRRFMDREALEANGIRAQSQQPAQADKEKP